MLYPAHECSLLSCVRRLCVAYIWQARLVALSATMANAPAIMRWLSDIHGETELISTQLRPVPAGGPR